MKIDTNKVVLLLAEQEMTKTDLAEKCGIARQNISIILGRGSCTPTTAGKLAKGLGVPVSEIMKEES